MANWTPVAYASFSEWNNNPEISRAAERLYRNIDRLELYVGLQAEQAKDPGPGSGLCPGYTTSRAILADAVCLTRGDRFLTTDFTREFSYLVVGKRSLPCILLQHSISPLGVGKIVNMTRKMAHTVVC